MRLQNLTLLSKIALHGLIVASLSTLSVRQMK